MKYEFWIIKFESTDTNQFSNILISNMNQEIEIKCCKRVLQHIG